MPASLYLAGVVLALATSTLASPPLEGIARRMTQEAIEAGIAGQDELRGSLHAKAMELAPDYAPARWEAGQMNRGGEWISVAQVQSEAGACPLQKEYALRRSKATSDASSHYELAKWCDANKLRDEASYHWWQVLQAAPRNAEALERLELAWFQGQLVPRGELAELRNQQRQTAKELKEWNARIDQWTRRMAGSEAQWQLVVDEIRDQVDESAIPAFEQLAGKAGGRNTDPGNRKVDVSRAFLDTMADRETFAGTQTLVRHALLAESNEIRETAARHLPNRPQAEVVPLLLDCLTAPIESRFDIRITPSGRTAYVHELEVAGREADEVLEISKAQVVTQRKSNVRPGQRFTEHTQLRHFQTKYLREASLRSYQHQALAIERQVASANEYRRGVNERAFALLRQVTGKNLEDDPQAWWNDWQQANGYQEAPYRPPHYYRDSDYDYWVLPPNCIPMSCFLAGTPVWTKTGQQAIETLEPGDLVLCQDIESGELLFRPVLKTTLREPVPMFEIAAGGEVITATQGHPFWVPGKGWRMASELAASDRLLSVDGPVEITAVNSAPKNEAYNLVVAEHANYFVGTKGMLVHDNTPRSPAEASEVPR